VLLDPDQLELFDHWPNVVSDLYVTVESYTARGVCLRLQDHESESTLTLEPGDSLYTHEGKWILTAVELTPQARAERRIVFARASEVLF
jgi:hypothetical protein